MLHCSHEKAARSKALEIGSISRLVGLPCLLSVSLSICASAANVDWNGSYDSEWSIDSNWSTGSIPGTASVDSAIIEGPSDNSVVATPYTSDQISSIRLRDDSTLGNFHDMSMTGSFFLGDVSGLGGAHVDQHAGVVIGDDLRIGHTTNTTTDSNYLVVDGHLDVFDQIFVRTGTFEIDGPESTTTADSMRVLDGGEVFFDFTAKGVSSIDVANNLRIDSGAKLTIDLRGYSIGGNVIDLFTFGSLTGSFDSAEITILGLNGGTLTYASDRIYITISDPVHAQAQALWFIANPDSGEDTDLTVNSGHVVRDLSSPNLSYIASSSGDDLVYSVTWSGSDFDGNGSNDTISFDLRVEGFSGSAYSYSADENSSSMTGLGSSDNTTSISGVWGVGTDDDLDDGQSLRFTVENISVSVSGYTPGLLGFQSFRMEEVTGGNTHQLIIGEGTDLQSTVSNFSEDLPISTIDPFIVTSAGSATLLRPSIKSVAFQISLSAASGPSTFDASDYSVYPTGPEMDLDYAAETQFVNYPAFSWDTVPRWASINGTLDSATAQTMAGNIDVMTMGGFRKETESTTDAGVLKSFNPDIKTLFYKNTLIHFTGFEADADFDFDNWYSYTLDTNGDRVYDMIRTYFSFNHDYPELRDWWVDLCLDMVARPEIDGIFIDKADSDGSYINDDGIFEAPLTGNERAYYDLAMSAPSGTLIVGNSLRNERTGGSRSAMQIFSGSYIERWDLPNDDSPVAQSDADARAVSIQLMREAAEKGKILMPAFEDRMDDSYLSDQIAAGNETALIEEIRERVTLPLAYYLIVAEEYSYFRYQPDQNIENYPEYVWDPTAYVDELTRPLGAPLGPPEKDGYEYTRSFKYVDVWLDVANNIAELDWFSPDIVGYWNMERSGVTMLDNSYTRSDATRTGGAAILNGSDAFDGVSLNFDGADDSMTIPSQVFDSIDDEISIAMWVKGGVGQPRSDTIFRAEDSSGQRVVNIHLPWSNSKVYWDAGNDGGSSYDRMVFGAISASQAEGNWHHWVFIKNASTGQMEIYIDGALLAQASNKTKTLGSVEEVRVGSGIGDSYYQGAIDEVIIYDIALTASEVAELYNSY